MRRVLLVEDSEEGKLVVERALAGIGIELSIASTCREAINLLSSSSKKFDLAILDFFLPDGDGFEVLQALRKADESDRVPVYFLTTADELSSKVIAFNLGADDFLIKPINPIELRARIDRGLKRLQSPPQDTLRAGPLQIDLRSLRAAIIEKDKTQELHLTGKEFRLLAFLIQNQNKVFTRSELVSAIWGNEVHILDRTIDSHVYGLRKKLGHLSSWIESIPNAGYRFRIDNEF